MKHLLILDYTTVFRFSNAAKAAKCYQMLLEAEQLKPDFTSKGKDLNYVSSNFIISLETDRSCVKQTKLEPTPKTK